MPIEPGKIRELTEYLKGHDSSGQALMGGRALEVTRLLHESGKLTPFALGARLKGVTLLELEDVLNQLAKLGLIERQGGGDQEEVVSLSERGIQIAASMGR